MRWWCDCAPSARDQLSGRKSERVTAFSRQPERCARWMAIAFHFEVLFRDRTEKEEKDQHMSMGLEAR